MGPDAGSSHTETEDTKPPPVPAKRSHADRLARGALLQQGAQVIRLLGGFGVLTLLARELSLSELGLYGILLSLTSYAQYLKSSVMNAAVLGVADTLDDRDRVATVVSTGLVIYTAVGLVAAVVLGAIGLIALPILDIPSDLENTARVGVAGLAIVTAIGWPVQIFDDLLRGQQRFAAVSVLEILATVLSVLGMVGLVVAGAPVWALVTWNAAIPLVTGLCCLAALRVLGVRVGIASRHVTRAEMRRFGSVSGLLTVAGIADVVTYSVDRFILGAIRNAAAVGLYEGALQVQNVVRYLNGVLTQPIVPAARRFLAEGDTRRTQELLVRGLRYSLAATVPFVVVLCVASGPILETWLGAKFRAVEAEAAVFVGWWLVGANGGLSTTVLTSAGRFRTMAVLSWVVVGINVGVTLGLTPGLGIWGPVLGAVISFTVALAYSLPLAVRLSRVGWRTVAVQAWLPAYSTAAIIAAALVLIRVTVGLPAGVVTVVVAGAAVVGYWLLYATLWLAPDERALVRRTLRGAASEG
jgi:O-antigen/teichoic acid export membrane protein